MYTEGSSNKEQKHRNQNGSTEGGNDAQKEELKQIRKDCSTGGRKEKTAEQVSQLVLECYCPVNHT